jgi:hypothetical protein
LTRSATVFIDSNHGPAPLVAAVSLIVWSRPRLYAHASGANLNADAGAILGDAGGAP